MGEPRFNHRNVCPEEASEIASLYVRNPHMSVAEIAQRFHRDRYTISQVLKRNGVRIRSVDEVREARRQREREMVAEVLRKGRD